MFDFSEILTPHIEALKPHATGYALELRAFGHRTLELLETIAENTRDVPFVNTRKYCPFTLLAAPTGGVRVLIDTVPATEEWEIESLRGGVVSGGGAIHIYDTDTKGSGDAPIALVGVGDITSTSGIGASGTGVIVPGGTNLWAVGSGGSQQMSGVLQVNRRYRKPARPGTAGLPNPATTGGPNGNSDIGRHSGTWHPNGVQ